jgi:hypothetical protein
MVPMVMWHLGWFMADMMLDAVTVVYEMGFFGLCREQQRGASKASVA